MYVCMYYNRFDFLVADVSLVGLVLQLVSSNFHVIALVRPLRVLRYVLLMHFQDCLPQLFASNFDIATYAKFSVCKS